MPIDEYHGRKYVNGLPTDTIEKIAIEGALQININGEPFTISMRTPTEDKELIRGLLYAEDVYKSTSPLTINFKSEKEGITSYNVTIPKEELSKGYLNSRTLLSVASCGICGKKELEEIKVSGKKLDESLLFSPSILPELFKFLSKDQITFKHTGGTHAAAAFSITGKPLFHAEDVGRHNAVDKVVGKLLNSGKLKEAYFLLVSGRISYEIITKCFKAGIPVLAAISAPTTLSIDFSKELGVTLLAFCRDESFTCYAHPERLKK